MFLLLSRMEIFLWPEIANHPGPYLGLFPAMRAIFNLSIEISMVLAGREGRGKGDIGKFVTGTYIPYQLLGKLWVLYSLGKIEVQYCSSCVLAL